MLSFRELGSGAGPEFLSPPLSPAFFLLGYTERGEQENIREREMGTGAKNRCLFTLQTYERTLAFSCAQLCTGSMYCMFGLHGDQLNRPCAWWTLVRGIDWTLRAATARATGWKQQYLRSVPWGGGIHDVVPPASRMALTSSPHQGGEPRASVRPNRIGRKTHVFQLISFGRPPVSSVR